MGLVIPAQVVVRRLPNRPSFPRRRESSDFPTPVIPAQAVVRHTGIQVIPGRYGMANGSRRSLGD